MDNYNNIVQQFPDVKYQAVKKALQRLRKKSAVIDDEQVDASSMMTYLDWYSSFQHTQYVEPEDESQKYSYVEPIIVKRIPRN